MKRPTALVDCDGVLADFEERANAALLHLGVYLDREAWDGWDVFSHPAIQQHKKVLEDALNAPGFCEGMKPLPGAQEGLAMLAEHADVYIVTSPWRTSPHWAHERARWLHDHFGVPWKRIVSTHAKYLVRGALLIDDKPEHVENWTRAHAPDGFGVLWSQPYNRSAQMPAGLPIIRSSSWHHITALVSGRTINSQE